MFLQTVPFVQWQDTITFHASLFRCFLANSELTVLLQSSESILAVIAAVTGQTLLSPLGRFNDAMTRCPPRRREAPSLTSLAMIPTDPPAILYDLVPQPIHVYDPHSHFEFDLPGHARVPLGNGFLFMGVVAWFLLWLFTLVIAMWRSSGTARAQSAANRIIPRPLVVAVDAAANAGKQDRPLLRDQNEMRHLIMGVHGDVDIRVSMPGAWHHECRMQNTLDISTDMTVLWFVLDCARWLSGMAPSGALIHKPNYEMTVVQTFENNNSLMCQGLDANTTTPALDYVESGPSDVNPHKSATRCEPPTISDVAIKDLDTPREDGIESIFTQVASADAIHLLCQDLDRGDSTSEDRTDGTEDQGLISIDTRRPDISTLSRTDDFRVLSRRQGGTLSDTGYPLPHRRSYSAGRKHDILDEEVSDDDSYWTEQVNSRLSSPRMWRYGYGWSDVSLWPREGRGDKCANWRARHGVATRGAPSEKATRRHSSQPINMNASTEALSEHASDSGIYVVPQKRGGCYSSSNPRASERPSALGFFPFRNTPSLLTPEAWRAGCLYTPDALADEASRAEAWWDRLSLNSVADQPGVARDRQPSWRDKHENDPASRRFYAAHRRATTEG